MLSSFHLPPLRHQPPLCCDRCRSQPSASTQAICYRNPPSAPLGGCRCALFRRNNRSVLFQRSAALTLRSLLQIPAFCLSAQGITARLAAGCFFQSLPHKPNFQPRFLLPFFHFSPPAPC